MKVNLAASGITPEMLAQIAERTRKELESQPERYNPVTEPTGRGQMTKNYFREQVATLAPMVESLTRQQATEIGGATNGGLAGLLRTFQDALERNRAALKSAPEAPGLSIKA